MRQSSRALMILAVLLIAVGSVATQAEMPKTESAATSALSAKDHELLNEFLEQLVREAIPLEYENHKQWGKTKEVVVGMRVERGRRWPQFEKRKKAVQHGTWKAYRVRLIDPDNALQFSIDPPRMAPDGGLRIDVHATADLEVIGRLAEWCYDVQLFSFNAQARTRVQFDCTCDVRLQLDPKHTPPDVLLRPVVRDARLEIVNFELERVSQLNGAAAQELGETLHPLINEVLDDKREKLVERLNRQIAKKQDKLRLSLHEVATSMWREAFVSEVSEQP